jgi:uncharacterized protein (TIGR02453 family)
MIQDSTLKFLRGLRRNNNKAWMDDHRNNYEIARADFLRLTENLVKGIGLFDQSIAELKPSSCIFRQNRDIRFSKDKSPYKTAMGAYMNKGGKKNPTAGYYFHLEPGNSFIAGGLWMPESSLLAKVRQEIDYNAEEWRSIVNDKHCRKYFNKELDQSQKLIRPPKGYSEDNPAIEFLLLKSFIRTMPLEDKEVLSMKQTRIILSAFQSLKPMIDFLNRAMD